MTTDKDKSIIECVGCSVVLYSQKTAPESGVHYDYRTGDLWCWFCWQDHEQSTKKLERIK